MSGTGAPVPGAGHRRDSVHRSTDTPDSDLTAAPNDCAAHPVGEVLDEILAELAHPERPWPEGWRVP